MDAPSSPRHRRARRRWPAAVALPLALVLLSACLPTEPSAGRGTPVRRVLVLGDSITFGLFGTSPRVHELLDRRLDARGVRLVVDGFPGENPLESWPGNPRWADRMRAFVRDYDPDMVVIQSILFPGSQDPDRRWAYADAMTELLDAAQSRGAHVYLVSHHSPGNARERADADIAQLLQGDLANRRGVQRIPLDWWMARCDRPFVDGWHLSAAGQACHADAVTAAVAQLQQRNG